MGVGRGIPNSVALSAMSFQDSSSMGIPLVLSNSFLNSVSLYDTPNKNILVVIKHTPIILISVGVKLTDDITCATLTEAISENRYNTIPKDNVMYIKNVGM